MSLQIDDLMDKASDRLAASKLGSLNPTKWLTIQVTYKGLTVLVMIIVLVITMKLV